MRLIADQLILAAIRGLWPEWHYSRWQRSYPLAICVIRGGLSSFFPFPSLPYLRLLTGLGVWPYSVKPRRSLVEPSAILS